ncbi:hypothetical protein [Mycobacterium sp. 1245801.1]|uniref:hypothetical protein n=1 Tax=Mycobacterium sp. 1245801.1 TaxID=1834075 RepID=UPI0007FDA944|nr:hypothetical protein [Mycobacterium sp. 1245801.1]OBJ14575.1 hypothetical protein A5622_03745 [Mycobacterium sp. 1245801.1]
MSTAEVIALVSAIAAPLLTFLGVVIGAWRGRADGKRQSEQALRELEVKARLASEQAADEARNKVTEAWEAYAASSPVALNQSRLIMFDPLTPSS